MKKIFKKIVSAIAIMSMISGCGSDGVATYDTKNYVDFYLIGSDFSSLNYISSHLAIDISATQNIVDGLVETDKYGQIVGLIAESWTHENYQTWTFKIKKGVQWSTSDGEVYGEVTADDFVYAVEYLLDPTNGATSNLHFAYLLEGAEDYFNQMREIGSADFSKVGVKAIDTYTVQYTCTTPMSYFLSAVGYSSFKPLNRAYVESIEDKDGVPGTLRFGTSKDLILYNGPYILTEAILDNQRILTKNENYHAPETVPFDTVTCLAIKDTESSLEYFERGDLSRAVLSATQTVKKQEEESPYLVQLPLSSSIYGMLLNNQGEYEGAEDMNKAVDNENFRKSLMYAVDSDQFNEVSIPGDVSSVRATTITAEDFIYTEDGIDYCQLGDLAKWANIDYLYDEQKALEYKEKAIEELKAQGVTFPVVYKTTVPSGNEVEMMKAQILENNLEEILGEDYIDVVIGEYSTSWFSEIMAENDYTVYLRGWGPDFKDPSNILGVWTSDSGQMNDLVMHWVYDEFDQMFEAANEIYDDVTARYTAFANAEAWLLEHAYFIPMTTNGGTYTMTTINPYSKAYTKGDSTRYTHWEAYDHALTTDEIAQMKAEWEVARSEVLGNN